MSIEVRQYRLKDPIGASITSADVVAALGYTPEDEANKKTDLTDDSDTYYASQKAVKTYVEDYSIVMAVALGMP